ncbi:MAG TPA: SDR family NAD(P)-dependent oxidoreductase [Methylovirgula sp.]|nr:SDR family NAD(P)-dependent oxidoreductase [Methylovirgula sp.]
MTQDKGTALIVGVGAQRGLGAALCRRFASEGLHAVAVGRTEAQLKTIVAEIETAGGSAAAIAADATQEADVVGLFDRVLARGPLDVVVFNAGINRAQEFRAIDAADFETFWRIGCFAGFLVGREAARRLAPQGHGTIIFTGASGSLRGRAKFAAFAAAKSGLRAVAQSMAREFGPAGLHVAHVIIDGGIDGDRLRQAFPQLQAERGDDGLLQPEAIAETYWQIHRQPRSAWTHELDLRPFKESF